MLQVPRITHISHTPRTSQFFLSAVMPQTDRTNRIAYRRELSAPANPLIPQTAQMHLELYG